MEEKHHRHRLGLSSIATSHQRASFLGLSLGSNAASGLGELEKSSESCLSVSVAEESLLLDDRGGVVNVTSKLLRGDGGVGHGLGLSLGDIVLLLSLDCHDESSLEILCSLVLFHGDANGVAHLAGVVHAVAGEGAVGPVLAVPLGLRAVESLGNSPDNVL